jgi:hypothetical protein
MIAEYPLKSVAPRMGMQALNKWSSISIPSYDPLATVARAILALGAFETKSLAVSIVEIAVAILP